jgi:hypothetical protein
MEQFETKDMITIIGIVMTFIVSAFSLYIGVRNSKKTLFINSVTSSRIKWIDTIRNNISEFCGLTYHYAITPIESKEKQQIVEKIDKLRFLIKLQLNRGDNFDKKILAKIDIIPNLTDSITTDDLKKEIDELIELTQDLLKLEWEGVKQESMKGILPKSEKDEMYEKYLKTKPSR